MCSSDLVLIIYTGIPLAAVGGVFALWLRGIPFSVSAAVGFIALAGIAVLNGQVLVAAIRTFLDDGLELADAVVSAAKQRLLGRVSNYARCQFCGFEGPLATPIVYHDNDKELLMTYFPPELGLPVNEQEKLVGPLITKVMNSLPAEKRKGYLLRPQTFLTFQSLIEKILEKDGVSKEMLDEQQKRLGLIQRLLQTTSPEARTALIKEEAAQLDETFFALFNRLVEAAVNSGQEQTAQAMAALQEELLANSEYGQKLQAQMGELEAAVKSLQDAGQGLTREKLRAILPPAASLLNPVDMLSSASPQGASLDTISANVPVFVDFTGVFNGYITDMTRIFVIGDLDPQLKAAFDLSLKIQAEMQKELVPGAICEELFLKSAEMAVEGGLGDHYMGMPGENAKFVGHGVGLELDEFPVLAQGFKVPLQAGQTIAIEPKFVFPGKGVIGIENTFAVTANGGEKLTDMPDDIVYL